MRKTLLLLSAVALVACGDSSDPIDPGPSPSLSFAVDTVLLSVSGTATLTPTIVNSTGTAQYVVRNQNIAQVSQTGVVTGLATGTTVVVASLSTNSNVRDSVVVRVTAIVDPPASVSLSPDSVAVNAGSTTTINVVVTGVGGTPVLSSRNEAIARVTAAGIVTGVAVGRTVIIGGMQGNAAIHDSVIVNVLAPPPPPTQLPLLGTGAVPERFTAEVAVLNNIAYTTTWGTRNGAFGNAVKIWNVSGNTPLLIDSLIVPNASTLGDVQISDDGSLLVVAIEGGSEAGIMIYNRANTPQRPTLIRRFSTTTTRQGVHTLKLARVNNRHYAFLSINPSGGQPAKLDIVDITDTANPTEVFVQSMGNPFIHDVFVRDGVLFTALWHTGMTIWDVGGAGRGGTPSNPVPLGTVKTAPCSTCSAGSSSVHNVWWFHDQATGSKRYAFIGEEAPANLGGFQSAAGALHVVDVSDFSNPREVAVYEPNPATTSTGQRAGAHNFVGDEQSGILYAAFYNGGVRALDVRGDLGTCTAAQKTSDGRCDLLKMGREVGVAVSSGGTKYIWGVALEGNRLYASDMPNGLHKIDISALKR